MYFDCVSHLNDDSFFFFFSFLMSTEFSCARVDAVFVHRHGQKSHIKGMK